MHDTGRCDNLAQSGGLQELGIQAGRYGRQMGRQSGHDRVARCGVEHGCQHPALHSAVAIRELLSSRKSQLHFTGSRID